MITIVQSTVYCVIDIRDIKPCVWEHLLACLEPWRFQHQSISRWAITPVTRFRTSNIVSRGQRVDSHCSLTLKRVSSSLALSHPLTSSFVRDQAEIRTFLREDKRVFEYSRWVLFGGFCFLFV